MGSAYTRGQIVSDALSLAGRSSELRQSANQWLNYFLQHVALNFRFPELRKIGTPVTLPNGGTTAALPSDFGAGMVKQGLLFGTENTPLEEYDFDDFVGGRGFPPTNSGTGRPRLYLVDRNAGVFRFNGVSDQAYSFTPVYYSIPSLPDPSIAYDNSKLWLDDDLILVQGLVWFIYQFTQDEREMPQGQLVMGMLRDWKREVVKTGGTNRLSLAPSVFKNVGKF